MIRPYRSLPLVDSSPSRPRWRGRVFTALRILQVRLRFLVVLLVIFLVVGEWDLLATYWERLTTQSVDGTAPVSRDTEYWCPMCPGVVSDWPGKCPVCNMDLVRRSKQEAVPLPSGVMARMQLSPCRIQLAGVQTSEVCYRHLVRQIAMTGRLLRDDRHEHPNFGGAETVAGIAAESGRLCVIGEVFESDIPFLTPGQCAEVLAESVPGNRPFRGQVAAISLLPGGAVPHWQVRVVVDALTEEVPVGSTVRVRIAVPVALRAWAVRSLAESCQQRASAELTGSLLLNPSGVLGATGLSSLFHAAGARAFQAQEQVLSVPESAVVDTGSEQVVYLDRGQGMFDAVAVTLGPRCGDDYPVLKGLSAGERVVTRGAFLLDAENHLNPATASMYFGASAATPPAAPAPAAHAHHRVSGKQESPLPASLSSLSAEDRALVQEQGYCPVNPSNRLGSMGPPCKVFLKNQPVFLCCQGCRAEALAHPDEMLKRLAQLKRRQPPPSSFR